MMNWVVGGDVDQVSLALAMTLQRRAIEVDPDGQTRALMVVPWMKEADRWSKVCSANHWNRVTVSAWSKLEGQWEIVGVDRPPFDWAARLDRFGLVAEFVSFVDQSDDEAVLRNPNEVWCCDLHGFLCR